MTAAIASPLAGPGAHGLGPRHPGGEARRNLARRLGLGFMLRAVVDRTVAGAAERKAPVDDAEARRQSDAADRELVGRAQAGDRKALGELLHKYGPGLYRSVLLPRLGSEAAAKDALAETYAKVVANVGKFVWQNVGFYPWLRTVALRVALDQIRARKRVVLFEPDDLEREVDAASTQTPVEQQVSDARDRDAARRKVDDALAKLNPRYAQAIRMRVLEERPREEVAAELGCTPATFDVLLHRAIASLKKALGTGGEGNQDG